MKWPLRILNAGLAAEETAMVSHLVEQAHNRDRRNGISILPDGMRVKCKLDQIERK